MSASYRDRYKTSISNTPGASGNFTISTPVTNYVGFVAGDNGLLFDILIEDGSNWEIRKDCQYTHSGTTLNRGTFINSNTGSAINLTSSAILSNVFLAERTSITINGTTVNLGDSYNETDPVFVASAAHGISGTDITNWNSKQDVLISGSTIKTVNSNSLLGIGDIQVQDMLVSGTNIKTINGNDLTGPGNIVISSGQGLGSITAYKADGSQDNIDITANTTLTQLTISQEQIVNTAMHYAIDTTANYGWNDITSEINVKGSGVNNPTWTTVRNGLSAYTFSATTMNECWCAFHIPHTYTPGTGIYLHAHWVNPGTNTGNVVWGFEYAYAHGYGRGTFPATSTVTVTQASGGQYVHNIAEISSPILAGSLEVDGILYVRIYRDAANVADTCTDAVALLTADVHHQTSRWATKSKNYPFY